MFKNYLITAFRNIKKHKGYSFINILGLAMGLACFILIFLYIQYELSYDKYHENSSNIYRIVSEDRGRIYKNSYNWAQTHPAVVYNAEQEIPDIKEAVRFLNRNKVPFKIDNSRFLIDNFYFAEPDLFQIFSLPLLKGDLNTMLENPHSILLSESLAARLFGNQESLDQTIEIDGKYELRVTGIFKDIPENSHFTMNCIVPYKFREVEYGSDINTWRGMCYAYVLLSSNADIRALEQKLNQFPDQYFYENEEQKEHRQLKYHLQPLSRIHLHSNLNFEIQSNNNLKTILIFLSIAFLILIIACINYMNLTTAKSSERFKEVGVRKVFGAHRNNFILQYLIESFLITISSLLVSLVIVYIALPYFSNFVEKTLTFNLISSFTFLLGLCGLVIFVGFIVGSYPAIFLASLRPVAVLQNIFWINKKFNLKDVSLRKILVVAQFTISILLIVGVLIIKKQLHFIQSTDVGYNKDQIVVVTVRDDNIYDKIEILKSELKQHDQIEAVSLSSNLPNHMDYSIGIHWPEMPQDFRQMMNFAFVDYDFIDLYGIDILEGRNFSRKHTTDQGGSYILNQTAVDILGWESPLGRQFDHWDFRDTRNFITGKIVGIIDDFHLLSLHNQIEPLYLMLNLHPKVMGHSYLSIKIKPEDIPGTLAFIQKKYTHFSTVYPFEYHFFDDVFDSAYRQDKLTEQMVQTFAGIAIFIACLGLFGLASFTAQQNTKEIGIRKVLGASVSGIIILLTKEFIKWVLIANVIALPIAYYIMNKWLQNFAYRVGLNWWLFVLAGGLALIIALLAVSYQTIKAATANPVDSLRYE